MRDGKDAVCFTAGFEGAAFSAGVIHAYLAADRLPPKVVAGISMGALSAAAMQKAYREFQSGAEAGIDTEAARWAWYRRYLGEISDRPLDVLWDAIPDPSDFFAEMPPVRDAAVPDRFEEKQQQARRSRFLLVLLGRWLAGLTVRVNQAFDVVVRYVRWKEEYPEPALLPWLVPRLRRLLALAGTALPVLARLVVAVAFGGFFPERLFSRRRARPLFGWTLFVTSWLILAAPFVLATILGLAFFGAPPGFWFWWIALFLLVAAPPASFAFPTFLQRRGRSLIHGLLSECGCSKSLVNDFHLRQRLMSLFDVDENAPVGDQPMPALLVAAPLPTLTRRTSPTASQPLVARQVWAGARVPLIEALRAALALPVVLEPLSVAVSRDERIGEGWLGRDVERPKAGRIDLVDGSVIRQNPIPALFRFLKDDPHLTEELRGAGLEDAAIHVVYGVPAGPVVRDGDGTFPEELANIVDIARLSSRLARRRDTQVEVAQTNFLSRLELVAGSAPAAGADRIWPVFADEIAPEADLAFDNPLSPQRSEVLERAASGCRATLERLYTPQIGELARSISPDGNHVSCADLLADCAPARFSSGETRSSPGVQEVCGACPKILRRPRAGMDLPTFDPFPRLNFEAQPPVEIARSLSREEPRIVLVTSGGVFRGSFHIGLAGALLATGVRPDLIVGASVGSLMGAAIGKMFDGGGAETLEKLVSLFLRVDRKVALTKTLKTAAREIGVRGCSVDLSPAELRRLIREGSRADAGYAAAGAPPALIDAISDLFMIPHRETARIAAGFVAGHVTMAFLRLMGQLKRETIRRLDVQNALMGVSLLGNAFRDVLFEEPFVRGGAEYLGRQPFARAGLAFYCTTTDLGSESAVILGDDTPHPGQPWDFLECCLSSSAFPAVFSPRRESDLFPGTGSFSRRYADGGMFDNLPFLPAIRILAHFQAKRSETHSGSALDRLRARQERPDLILVGALDVNPEEAPDRDGPFESIPAIGSRAATLRNNVKIRSFEAQSEIVHRLVKRILALPGVPSSNDHFLDAVVDAGVLPVFPMDKEHLNETFGFCRSTGLHEATVRKSIANGCFETLRALVAQRGLAGKALEGLRPDRAPWVRRRAPGTVEPDICPYYSTTRQFKTDVHGKKVPDDDTLAPLACPFARGALSREVFAECTRDPGHRKRLSMAASGSGGQAGPRTER